ncbi:hypothetical protein EV714DRAFT_239465 [Schizophyllum commune]
MSSFIQMDGGSGSSSSTSHLQPRSSQYLPRPPSISSLSGFLPPQFLPPSAMQQQQFLPPPALQQQLPPGLQQQQISPPPPPPPHSVPRQPQSKPKAKVKAREASMYTLPSGITLSHRIPNANGERTPECDFHTVVHDIDNLQLPQLKELVKLLDLKATPDGAKAKPKKTDFAKALQDFSAEKLGGQAVWKHKYEPVNTRSHKGPVNPSATTTASGRPRKDPQSRTQREKMLLTGVIGLRPETRIKPDLKIMNYMINQGCSLSASDPLLEGEPTLTIGPDNEWNVIPATRTSQASSVITTETYRPPPSPSPSPSLPHLSSGSSDEPSATLTIGDQDTSLVPASLIPEFEILLAQMKALGVIGLRYKNIRRELELHSEESSSVAPERESVTPSFIAAVAPAFPAVPQQAASLPGRARERWPLGRLDGPSDSEPHPHTLSTRSVSSTSSTSCFPPSTASAYSVSGRSSDMQVDSSNEMSMVHVQRPVAMEVDDAHAVHYMCPGPNGGLIECKRRHLSDVAPCIPYSDNLPIMNAIYGPWEFFTPYPFKDVDLNINGQAIPVMYWQALLQKVAPDLYSSLKSRLSDITVVIREYRSFASHADYCATHKGGFTATLKTVRKQRKAATIAFAERIRDSYGSTFGKQDPHRICKIYLELADQAPAKVDAGLVDELRAFYYVPPTFTPAA